MTRIGRTWLLAAFAVGTLALSTGCPDYQTKAELTCDATTCYVCKGLDCYQYQCSSGTQCPTGFTCGGQGTCTPGSSTPLAGGGGGGGSNPGATNIECDGTTCFICTGIGAKKQCAAYACGVSSTCPSGYACNAASQCVFDPSVVDPTTPVGCVLSSECADGQLCVNGHCITETKPTDPPTDPQCKTDAECGAGMVCGKDGLCAAKELPLRPAGTCEFNLDCGASGTCINTKCYFPPATSAAACPPHAELQYGLCLPMKASANECTFSSECGERALCVDATCFGICSVKADCSGGNYCGSDALCILDDRPRLQCQLTADCPTGSCVDGRCLAGCGAGATCAGESEVCRFGFCQPVPACFEASSCSGGAACINGACNLLETLAAPKGDPSPSQP